MWNRGYGKSRWFFVGFGCALAIILGAGALYIINTDGKGIGWFAAGNMEIQPVLASQEAKLTLKKTYVCGIEDEEKVTKMVPSMEQVFLDFKDWELVSQEEDEFVFKQYVHDLAPICKDKGYFGMSGASILTLFEGPPAEQKVIQTFFQIDTKKLESGLLHDDLKLLEKGIRIHDLSEYNSILSTYGEYSDSSPNDQPSEPRGE